MTDNLEELERLLAKATPGEWAHDGIDAENCCSIYQVGTRDLSAIAVTVSAGTRTRYEGANNAALIVALHNAAPSLIATAREVEGLRAKLAELAKAEADYRQLHDIYGGSHIQTGRAWDRMRHAGDAARAALEGKGG